MKILLLIAAGVILASADNKPCRSRDFGEGSTVCVCTADFCDTLDPLGDIPTNQFYHLESSQEGLHPSTFYPRIRFVTAYYSYGKASSRPIPYFAAHFLGNSLSTFAFPMGNRTTGYTLQMTFKEIQLRGNPEDCPMPRPGVGEFPFCNALLICKLNDNGVLSLFQTYNSTSHKNLPAIRNENGIFLIMWGGNKNSARGGGTITFTYTSVRNNRGSKYAILDKIIGVPDVVVKINRNTKYQKIIGFGGSFTDAATINIAKLSSKLQDHIIEAYYGKTGLEYNIGRINMAGCDFSERLYSYADVEGDVDLEHFSLVREDTEFKIPYVLKSLALNPNIKMFASPWTAPKWMKTNNEYYGQGSLKKEYYQAWANYFVKFLDEYQKLGVTFWAVTAQNEPLDGLLPGFSFNCMGWFPEEQRDFIKINLGPSIETSDHKDTKIIIVDDQRAFIVSWSNTILNDPDAAKYVSGIGVHWYADLISTPSLLATTHRQHPDKFILATEACTGAFPGERPVILGSWHRGELYAADIIEDLNYFVAGWTDWNLVLDMDGGPNWAGNTVDAPIIADSTTDQIYKQPMYYVLGHFSKFIPEDSVRIDSTSDDLKKLFVLTVERPDGKVVAVILNQYDLPMVVALEDEGKVIELLIKAHSIHTLIYTP
ncbi:unnamed protein product [Allacma fusca]|uniref:Glucosylceramidase n=1 Tax=Allacma fusca TaxID=39272 RepID=A0A8J2LNF8_9HEXA|nr:unnamed protein product [Allacma fusca]